jgi:hypothetical protein
VPAFVSVFMLVVGLGLIVLGVRNRS